MGLDDEPVGICNAGAHSNRSYSEIQKVEVSGLSRCLRVGLRRFGGDRNYTNEEGKSTWRGYYDPPSTAAAIIPLLFDGHIPHTFPSTGHASLLYGPSP